MVPLELRCNMESKLRLSPLGHTWLLDIDGTILRHNGYKTPEGDSLLEGALEFLNSIPEGDVIIFLTSRESSYSSVTEQFFKDHSIRFDKIIYDLPYGERILMNDDKPSGLKMGCAVNKKRNSSDFSIILIDEKL